MVRVTLCVDALEPNPGGIGRYTWELCKGLAADRRVDPLHFFGQERIIYDPALLLRGASLPPAGSRWRKWLDRRDMRSSIVHGPNYFLPSSVERGIITVHDLSVFLYPETHPAERVSAFEKMFANSLTRASHVLTDTETVRREVIDMFSVAPDMITAVPLGVDATFKPQSAAALAPMLRRWELEPGRYGLCVSTLEPRKRIEELLNAWRGLPARLRETFPLVMCGGAGWRNEQLRERVDAGVREGWLRHLGFVEETLLPQLYAGAALFIYPSIYEGFGLPPLEALASGVPVIVSNRSCLPEVCGDAARYFDPDDPVAFAGAIEHNLADTAWRKQAVERGVARARQFTWERCIDQTIDAYCQLD